MAVNRPLTSDEREILKGSSRYASQAQWALRNFAVYWDVESDINTKVGDVGYQRWALNWQWANKSIVNDQMITAPNIPTDFVNLSKNINLWDSGVPVPEDPGVFVDTVIDYMIANNLFEELAGSYVTLKTPDPAAI